MRNIGPKTQVWLKRVAVDDLPALKALGAVEVYLRMLEAGYPASLNALWALEGAIQDCAWQTIAREERMSLLTQLDAAREMRRT